MRKLINHVPEVEELRDLVDSLMHKDGREFPSNKKMALNVNIRPPTLQDQIKRILHHEIKRSAMENGFETIEESDDFDVKDDFEMEPLSMFDVMEDEVLKDEKESTGDFDKVVEDKEDSTESNTVNSENNSVS